jgi:hypothetical protein
MILGVLQGASLAEQVIWLAPATASRREFMAQPQKLKVTTTATKAQAAGAGALGVPALVVAIVQLFQIQLTPEQLSALTMISGAVAAFAGSYFATNSPVVQDVEQALAAVLVRLPDSANVRPAEQPVAAVPTGVVETPGPKVVTG